MTPGNTGRMRAYAGRASWPGMPVLSSRSRVRSRYFGAMSYVAPIQDVDRNSARPRQGQAVLQEVYDREDAREKCYLGTSRSYPRVCRIGISHSHRGRIVSACTSLRNGKRTGLARVVHPPTAVPNFYAETAGSGEQNVCPDLRLSVALAVDQVGSCDMVGGIQEIAAITWHCAPFERAA